MAKRHTKKSRQNTRLESEGAEFLVLGRLLIEGIDAYKNYRYMRDYDVVAALPERDRTARIQVKSRWASDASAFLISSFDCDFVVFVKLNRGYRYRYRNDPSKWSQGKGLPECYVFPASLVQRYRDRTSKWGRVVWRRIPDYADHRENWKLVHDFLTRRTK